MCDKFVIKDNQDNFFAIDINSGGYPYLTNSIRSAEIFANLSDALKVMRNDISRNSALIDFESKPRIFKITYEEVDVSLEEENENVIDNLLETLNENQLLILRERLK